MKLALSVVALASGALAGAAFAQGAPSPAPTQAQSTPPGAANSTPASDAKPMKHGYDPNTVICKWTEEIGTRLGGGKVCMTRAQWDQQSSDAQDQLNETDRRGGEAGVPGN